MSKALVLAVFSILGLCATAGTAHGQTTVSEERSPEVAFDSATRTVTVKLSVEDVDEYSIPTLRRNNFAVFEDGRRQENVSVDVEHSPITLAILMEMGGRSRELNRTLASNAVYTARPVLDALGPNDKFALFTYDDRLRTVIDFDSPAERWREAFSSIQTPHFSEANFYDAAIQVLDRLASIPGRRALLVISTGIDTFSRSTFDDVASTAQASKIPVYVIGLGESARRASAHEDRGPLSRVDWVECERRLQTLARISGGTAYTRDTAVSVAAIYDDIMEKLRVRYVVRYVSSQPSDAVGSRVVQVKLVDPVTGAPLKTRQAAGRLAAAPFVAQTTYTTPATSAAIVSAANE